MAADLDKDAFEQRRRSRNYALGGVLLAFVLIVFAVTIVKMAGAGA